MVAAVDDRERGVLVSLDSNPLRIAVASGKGGTGKTTIATSLALSMVRDGGDQRFASKPTVLDCDVEGPNAHLFLYSQGGPGRSEPVFAYRQDVSILIPRVDAEKCTLCGRCAEVCQYHAILVMGKRTLVFPELCHGCGSCTLVCPEGAITEHPHVIGKLEGGKAIDDIHFAQGVLNIGEPMAVPAIRQLKRWGLEIDVDERKDAGDLKVVILDAPPGASCPVVETVRGADYLLLVTEPTPFGLHDLRLAAGVAEELGVPAGVIINRDGIGDTSRPGQTSAVDEFCASAGLPILLRIPFDRAIAEGIARGRPLVEIRPEYLPQFRNMSEEIAARVQRA